MDNKRPELKDWLEMMLEERGMTWAELSRRCGTTPPVLYNIANGVRNLGPMMARKIAKAFNISQVEIFTISGLIDEGYADETSPNSIEALRQLARLSEDDQKRAVDALRAIADALEPADRRDENVEKTRPPRFGTIGD